jgi:hypothetical protein
MVEGFFRSLEYETKGTRKIDLKVLKEAVSETRYFFSSGSAMAGSKTHHYQVKQRE